MIIKEIFTPSFDVSWLPWAVQYFFMIGLAYSAGFIATMTIFSNLDEKYRQRILLLSGLLMISAGLVGPISLLGDLHQPARAWHFYMQTRTSSWMWYGAYLLPLFNIAIILFGWMTLRPTLKNNANNSDLVGKTCQLLLVGNWSSNKYLKKIAIISTIFGLAIATYTGMEVMSAKARALWDTPMLPFMMLTTAMVAAYGVLLILNRVLKGNEVEVNRILLSGIRMSLTLFILTILIWTLMDSRSIEQAKSLFSFSQTWQLSAFWVVSTVIVLNILLLFRTGSQGVISIITALIAIHLNWGLRWLILMQAQTVPKYGAGTYIYNISWGPEGILGIVGTFGLWFAIILIFSEFVRKNSNI
ncbi:polysulfide reductase NrfD [Vibrio sp. SS-MA-C1-2]|uniref:NrfD/PsrC family molybdoenzyme membrane anchor subunit n=1 Tax=Vibrio sp. SS-MA-C1-2 TaxID=2908646 RepID=UPI001F37DB6A|nr:NrfD/PsrC family molybdoenzyme membrane anchor subunit [Vibrio sp. SS-MA-C1-2]UJF17354.1 polysulfide reductase NrfD [Vibrio sp. SS-MA-C1-2]